MADMFTMDFEEGKALPVDDDDFVRDDEFHSVRRVFIPWVAVLCVGMHYVHVDDRDASQSCPGDCECSQK
jgi:hypothetical protein